MHVCLLGSKKRTMDPLQLESQAIVSCQIWLLGTNFCSSVRAARTFDCGAIFLALKEQLERMNCK